MRIVKLTYETRIYFNITNVLGRTSEDYITVVNPDSLDNNGLLSVSVPATGNMAIESVPEFLKAVELAGMIASGELVTE